MQILDYGEFEIHKLKGYIEEIFLVVYPERIFLLDGTGRPDVSLVESYITQTLRRPSSQLKLVVVSHMHPDHAGGAPEYRTKFGARIIASEFADSWYSGISGRAQHLLDMAMGQFVAQKKGGMNRRLWYRTKVQPDFIVRADEPLPLFPDWKIICTPGHTDHDISVYHPRYKLIYVADVVLRIRDKFLLPFPITLPAVMQKTMQKLTSLPIDFLLMAHGGIAKSDAFCKVFGKLSDQVFDKPNKKFKLLKYFVGIARSIKRAEERFAASQ